MLQLQDNDDQENTETSYDDWNNYIEDLQFANPRVEFVLHNTTPNTLPFNRTAMETLIKIFVKTVQNMEQQESKLI